MLPPRLLLFPAFHFASAAADVAASAASWIASQLSSEALSPQSAVNGSFPSASGHGVAMFSAMPHIYTDEDAAVRGRYTELSVASATFAS